MFKYVFNQQDSVPAPLNLTPSISLNKDEFAPENTHVSSVSCPVQSTDYVFITLIYLPHA